MQFFYPHFYHVKGKMPWFYPIFTGSTYHFYPVFTPQGKVTSPFYLGFTPFVKGKMPAFTLLLPHR